jgi:hypothetical protein
MHSVSVFMPTLTIDDPHATPYTQGIALVWRELAGAHAKPDPVALNRLLQIVGLGVTVFVLHAAYTWVRRQAGRRAGLIALPVLLLLFGPGHIIWAGDLTFHGFLYASYYPQTLATGFMLWSLIATDGPPVVWRFLVAPLPVAATMVVHPFTGTLLAVLIATTGSVSMITKRGGFMLGSWALVVGYLMASRWPEYSLSHAIAESGVKGPVLIGACSVLPLIAGQFGWAWRLLSPLALRLGAWVEGRDRWLAYAGFVGVLALAGWESWLFTVPNSDPLIHSNHLSLYWVEESWRWPLMFAAGAVGVVGLVRLARRGYALPLLWTLGCFAMGIAGAVGVQLPLWWRFLLFAQLPVALGVAVWLTDAVAGWAKRSVISTYAFTGAFKVATLLLLPISITYFGSSLQGSYALGKMLPPGPGVVASDPFTSYFVPAATGHSVLVVTKAHVASQDELNESQNGYTLLHRFYSGKDWWSAAQTMYRKGVRFVLVQKQTSLAPPDLVTFSTGPTPLIRTAHDRALLGTYFWRNNRVGVLLHDSPDYVLYRLSKKKLFG